MRVLGAATILLFVLATTGAVAALLVPTAGSWALAMLGLKLGVVGAWFAIAWLQGARRRVVPFLLVLALLLLVVPVAAGGLLAGSGALLAVTAAVLARRRDQRTPFLLAWPALLLAGARLAVVLTHPEWLLWFVLGSAGLGLLGFLCWLLYRAAIVRRVAAWLAVLSYALALLAAVLPTLSPAMQFNAMMILFIVLFILLAAAIATLFTFLFLKAFEHLERRFYRALLFFLPLTWAPGYLVARGLVPLLPPMAPDQAEAIALVFALDLVSGLGLLLLLVARAIGRRVGPRSFVPLIAWKFLRSQREVLTGRSRRTLALRELISGPRVRVRSLVHQGLETGLVVGAVLLASGLLPGWVANPVWVALVRAALATTGAAWLTVRTLTARRCALLGLGAVTLALVSLWDLYAGATFGDGRVPPEVAVAIGALPLALLLLQVTVRAILRSRQRRNRLPRALDARYAPKLESRMREGVGASVFASVVGVAIGVWALIVVLSVMGGFSGEMQERIVRTKDHIMVKAVPPARELPDALGQAEAIARLPGVVQASAYVEAEAMMSSNTNISSTVTVRGIDRDAHGGDFLNAILVDGSLHLFRHPEDLVPYPGMGILEGGQSPVDLEPLPFPGEEAGVVSIDLDEEAEGLEDGFGELGAPPDGPDVEGGPAELLDAPGLVAMPGIGDEDPGAAAVESPSRYAGGSREHLLPPVIIGQELARSLGAGIGSRITVISPDGDIGPMGVQPKARAFVVAAIFSTGMYEFDLTLAYMYLPDAQRFFNLPDGLDHIDVRLADLEQAPVVRDEILGLMGSEGVDVLTWQEMNRNLFSALKLERVVMFIVLGFIILIASFNIVTSLIIIIRRRLSAIAILKTMGAATRDITRIFFMLGSAAGLFGMTSGVIMGLSSCGIIENLGLTLPREYYIRSLPVHIDGWQIVQIALAALLITALASLYPGRLASRILLVEGLKDER